MGRDTVQLETAINTISQKYLLEFTLKYGILEALHPELPGLEDRIVDFPEGKARPSILMASEKYVFSVGIPSFGALVRQSTTVGNTLSSTQKKRLFQFLRESRGFV
nr:hypothetical protein [Tanacetum cinerariifolium]